MTARIVKTATTISVRVEDSHGNFLVDVALSEQQLKDLIQSGLGIMGSFVEVTDEGREWLSIGSNDDPDTTQDDIMKSISERTPRTVWVRKRMGATNSLTMTAMVGEPARKTRALVVIKDDGSVQCSLVDRFGSFEVTYPELDALVDFVNAHTTSTAGD